MEGLWPWRVVRGPEVVEEVLTRCGVDCAQVGLIAARRTGRLTGGKATQAIADKAKEKK